MQAKYLYNKYGRLGKRSGLYINAGNIPKISNKWKKPFKKAVKKIKKANLRYNPIYFRKPWRIEHRMKRFSDYKDGKAFMDAIFKK